MLVRDIAEGTNRIRYGRLHFAICSAWVFVALLLVAEHGFRDLTDGVERDGFVFICILRQQP